MSPYRPIDQADPPEDHHNKKTWEHWEAEREEAFERLVGPGWANGWKEGDQDE